MDVASVWEERLQRFFYPNVKVMLKNVNRLVVSFLFITFAIENKKKQYG
jgi:hypothetical protein